MYNINDRVSILAFVIFLLLAIPLLLLLLAFFNINPLAPSIVGVWKGNLNYIDTSTDSPVDAIFTFRNDGTCTMNLNQTYWDGDAYLTKSMVRSATWKQVNDTTYYLIYGNYTITMYIQDVKIISQHSKNLIFYNQTIYGNESPFQGYLVQ